MIDMNGPRFASLVALGFETDRAEGSRRTEGLMNVYRPNKAGNSACACGLRGRKLVYLRRTIRQEEGGQLAISMGW